MGVLVRHPVYTRFQILTYQNQGIQRDIWAISSPILRIWTDNDGRTDTARL